MTSSYQSSHYFCWHSSNSILSPLMTLPSLFCKNIQEIDAINNYPISVLHKQTTSIKFHVRYPSKTWPQPILWGEHAFFLMFGATFFSSMIILYWNALPPQPPTDTKFTIHTVVVFHALRLTFVDRNIGQSLSWSSQTLLFFLWSLDVDWNHFWSHSKASFSFNHFCFQGELAVPCSKMCFHPLVGIQA